jgi:cobalamin synthase
MTNVVKKEKKKQQHYLLPVMGLIIAVAMAAIAYMVAPIVIDLIRAQMGEARFDQRLGDFSEQNLRIAFAVVCWLVLFALSMMLVALFLNEDPEREDQVIRPRENASDKEWKRYEKQVAQIRAKRAKRAEQLARQQERNKR